jgi:ribulose-bisphosphate carboxylase small chain
MTSTNGDARSDDGPRISQRLGTFSYLPPFSDAEVLLQIDYLVRQGLEASIEHVEPERATRGYWQMWKLPLFGERDSAAIFAEVQRCRTAHPGHHVRLIGYDKVRQTQPVSFVVVRAP